MTATAAERPTETQGAVMRVVYTQRDGADLIGAAFDLVSRAYRQELPNGWEPDAPLGPGEDPIEEVEVILRRRADRGDDLARAIRHQIFWALGSRDGSGATASDVQAALHQMESLYATAGLLRFPANSLEPDYRALVYAPVPGVLDSNVPGTPAEGLEVRELRMGSPLELIASIPAEYITGGGLVAMLALASRIATFPVRVAERWAYYRAQTAQWHLQRSSAQRELIEQQAMIIEARSRMLGAASVEILDPEDPGDKGEPFNEPDDMEG